MNGRRAAIPRGEEMGNYMKYRVSFPLLINQKTSLDFDTEEEAQQFAAQCREAQDHFLARHAELTAKITVIEDEKRRPYY